VGRQFAGPTPETSRKQGGGAGEGSFAGKAMSPRSSKAGASSFETPARKQRPVLSRSASKGGGSFLSGGGSRRPSGGLSQRSLSQRSGTEESFGSDDYDDDDPDSGTDEEESVRGSMR
jgi:hypothetical protein